MHFISSQKLCWFSRYINFCPDFFAHVGKRLDEKGKVNFKNNDVKTWLTTNYS